jgi:hypothetical protein
MKKLVVTRPELSEVRVENVSKDKFYGAQLGIAPSKSHADKTIIVHGGYRPRQYIVCSASEILTSSYRYAAGVDVNLMESIKSMINFGYIIYQFDSCAELFKWLAEEE